MSDIKLDFAKQDGLLPVIVTDYKTGQVLMLAYMNEEAYRLTLETKQMHYWSRSRNELWQKGATSGHYQYVKSIKTDCDCDTLLVAVKQEGAACHTGAYSCFFNDIYRRKTMLETIYKEALDRKETLKKVLTLITFLTKVWIRFWKKLVRKQLKLLSLLKMLIKMKSQMKQQMFCIT